jgi:5-methylcytosine-specific restriction endonuclease McrA
MPYIPFSIRLQVFRKTDGRCWWCGEPIYSAPRGSDDIRAYTVDHILPIRDGGTNEPDNLVPACKRCNSRKERRGVPYLRRVLSGIPHFTQAQESYLLSIGVEIPPGDFRFYFEQEDLL